MELTYAYACNRFPRRSDSTRVRTRTSGGATAAQEQEVQAEGGVSIEDLPECPDHQPSSFLKGKPQSILSLLYFHKYHLRPFMLDALCYRSSLEILAA